MVLLFAKEGIIKSEEIELYEYGFWQMVLIVWNVLTVIIIGFALKKVWETIIFLLFFIPLRSFAGGYHAKNAFRCYFLSVFFIFAGIKIADLVVPYKMAGIIIIVFSILIIWLLSPIDSENKVLDEQEKKVYAYRSKVILMMELAIGILAKNVGIKGVLEIVTAVFVIVGLLQVYMYTSEYWKRKISWKVK